MSKQPQYLVFPLHLTLDNRALYDRALYDRALYNSGLHDRGLHDCRLHDCRPHDCGLHDVGRLWGPGLVGLLAVLLHLDGAAGGLRIGVGDRLLLDSRLWPPVVLIDREDAGGDGAADAADR